MSERLIRARSGTGLPKAWPHRQLSRAAPIRTGLSACRFMERRKKKREETRIITVPPPPSTCGGECVRNAEQPNAVSLMMGTGPDGTHQSPYRPLFVCLCPRKPPSFRVKKKKRTKKSNRREKPLFLLIESKRGSQNMGIITRDLKHRGVCLFRYARMLMVLRPFGTEWAYNSRSAFTAVA